MVEEPRYIENRQFVGYEEEDIQKMNQVERNKFDGNPEIIEIMKSIEQESANIKSLGSQSPAAGRWEEHWITVDPSGKRVYARIYYTEDHAWALTADGRIIREINYPKESGQSMKSNPGKTM